MSFLKRMIKDGIREGVSNAIGDAVKGAVEPAATNLANKAAAKIEDVAEKVNAEAAEKQAETKSAFSGLEGAFANLEKAAQSYATEISKNMKVCPECNTPTDAAKKFCPECGAKLPEETVADSSVCKECGTQNTPGTKFCQECGAKLPAAAKEEADAQAKDNDVMATWDEYMSMYPKWTFGGKDMVLEDYGGHIYFGMTFNTSFAAQNAVRQYKALLEENGFVQAGKYPSENELYKMIDGVCYHVSFSNCFENDPERPGISFATGEPQGGFDWSPQKEKQKEREEFMEGLNKVKGLFGKK